jgi:hypothetical protein
MEKWFGKDGKVNRTKLKKLDWEWRRCRRGKKWK